MLTAVLVIDMVNDNVHTEGHGAMAREAKQIIPAIQRLLDFSRQKGFPIVYPCDTFREDDFIFKGRMRPHALEGTPGCQVIPELQPVPGELVLPKRRFSAFWKTNLGDTLRQKGVGEVVLSGISSQGCVLTSAFDALSEDFYTIIISDCTAAYKPEVHQQILELFGRRFALAPLIRVISLEEFIKEKSA